LKDAIPVKITPSGNDIYTCEYMTTQLGVHSVNVFFAGNPIPDSPFGVKVGPASNPTKVYASGRGLQPHGLRAHETVDFKVFTEGAGEGTANVKIIGPGGAITPTTRRNIDPNTIEYKYTPEKDGRYRVMITWGGKEIPRSPFEVNIAPHKSTKIKAFGPGLKGGVVDMPALFTVDTCGETGALGFSIEGPSQAKINCKDNGDGSADVDYTPTAAGEYAVHILCDNEDIPGSPYMAQILPKTDYDPSKVKCFGPGIEGVVQPNVETNFTIDTTKAGKAPLDILFMDDYGEMKPLWKDENGIHDPKDGGIMAVKLIRAKELVKSDLIGKSDPYAVIKHGSQKFSTKVVKNSQDPEWNYEAQITIPDQGDKAITIELFDSDKIGKDKSLGSISFDASQIVKQKVIEQGWYPLGGVKSGQVLMSADFLPVSPSMARDILRPGLPTDGHKNLEVNRPLLEKKSDGIYECTYTPRKTQKQVIVVNYGGVAVPGSPFRVTVDDPTDPSKVKVYGKGVEDGNKTGQPVDFTIDCKEAGPGDLAINITDDKRREVPINVKDNGDHTFNVKYTPQKNGVHSISIKYDGRELPQSPIKVNVKTDIDLKKVKVSGMDDDVFVDCTNDFDVDTSGLPADVTPNIGCTIKCPDGTSLPNLKVDKPGPDGKAKVSYTPTKEGKHDINVTCDGSPIPGSPFKVKAKKGCDPSKVKAYGPGLEKGICHEPNQFTIETRNAGTGGLGLLIEGPAEAKMTCKDNRDGSCTVDYVPTEEGNYDITVKYEDQDIPGSPFNVPVVDLSPKQQIFDPDNRLSGVEGLPDGKLHMKIIKAKELIKADMVGKSDPYAVIKYGKQKFKTPTVKNSQEPKWDYDLEFSIPEDDLKEVNIEVFDSDKIGKDKSLGKVNIAILELKGLNESEGRWYSLTGVKSGKILLSADFLELPYQQSELPSSQSLKRGDSMGSPTSKKSKLPLQGRLPEGKACVTLVKAKELIKSDLVGKSDPYAILKYATQKYKTPTEKNTQEPKWDYHANFDVPEGDNRNVSIEVFDSDKIGKDKSLGKVELDLAELVNSDSTEGRWYPLVGVKSGKVLLYADFLDAGSSDLADASGALKGVKSDPKKGTEGLSRDDDLPDGKLLVNLIKAKELIKADVMGKSDPYATLVYGNQKFKTKTVKNSLEPLWNHEVTFDIPEGKCKNVLIEVFDADKFGKDKSIGKLDLQVADLVNMAGQEGKWFPLSGVKSGQVLLSADLLDALGANAKKEPSSMLGRKDSDLLSKGDNDGSPILENLPKGKATIKVIKAKELIKADMIGKSDPYAVLSYGNQTEKTKVVKNTQEPQWDHNAEFDFPEGNNRTFNLEVFDSDKLGKDKSLGKLTLDIYDVLAMDGSEGKWFPLSGVKSGKVLLSADFLDNLGRKASDILPSLLNSGDPNDPKGLKDFGGRRDSKDPSGVRRDSKDPSGGRKDSKDPNSKYPTGLGENNDDVELPSGKAKINVIKAKELIKTDMIGKSDPYAVISYGKQNEKTKVVKNTQEPQWNHEAEFEVPDGNSRTFNIEVFDSDKLGRDKSLGKLALDITDVLNMDGQEGRWFSLAGVKSGKILLSADFLDDLGRNPNEILPSLLKGGDPNDPYGIANRKNSSPSGKSGYPQTEGKNSGHPDDLANENADVKLPSGTAKINLIKAKELIKADMIGKSDPYAVLSYGKQNQKTKVVKNTQEPQWNHSAEFNVPDGDSRTFNIEVFDADKIGKDKSLGKLALDITDVLSMDGQEGRWYPLKGVKSGKVLLTADFLDDLGRKASDILPSLLSGKDPNDPYGLNGRKKSSDSLDGPHTLADPARKGVGDPAGLGADDQKVPSGKAKINLIKAKELIKSDIMGKSDPYAVLSYGKQKQKTNVVKNTQEPQWNHESVFNVPDGNSRTFNIEVFDSDKIGKDKPLGKLSLDITDILSMDSKEGRWFPLTGVKSGKVLLSADFLDDLGRSADDILPSLLKGTDPNDPYGLVGRKKSGLGGSGHEADLPEVVAKLKLVRAKELINADTVGKSDPYAVLIYGKQIQKTKTIKNTLEPEWNHEAEFNVPDGESRNFYIEVFDSDKLGKDTSLGNLNLDIADILAMDGQEGKWFPLSGVKSGKVLLAADFKDKLGHTASDLLPALTKGGDLSEQNLGRNSTNPEKTNPSALHGNVPGGAIPKGIAKINLVKAKELIQADKNSKSDPYAVLLYGKQVEKTKVVQNCHEPIWNHEAEFVVPDGNDRQFYIEVFDSDKVGKDTSLGNLSLDITDILAMDGKDGQWFPLEGVKSGKVLLTADFIDELGRKASDILPGILKGGSTDPSRQKDSTSPLTKHPSALHGDVPGAPLPNGKAKLKLIKAKELIQADKNSKSDPYAMLVYGSQVEKTKVIQNCHEPEWNHEAEFDFPDGDERCFYVEVFDSDKVGKDTSLGNLSLDITDILALDGTKGKWFPLSGVPSGKVLLSAEFLDQLGRKASDILPGLLKGGDNDNLGARKDSKTGDFPISNLPSGKAKLHVIKARNLIKADIVGKSDPYAVLIFGKQLQKTKTIRNTSEPEWNHEAEFDVPDGASRNFYIEVFDSDKLGKDKTLGKLNLDITDVLSLADQGGKWFPLTGVKSGELLLSADFLDELGRNSGDVLDDLLKSDNLNDPNNLPGRISFSDPNGQTGRKNSSDPDNLYGRKKSSDPLNSNSSAGGRGSGLDDEIPEGKMVMTLVKAKDLIKSDLVGKSDPYAVLTYGLQKHKTPVVKNTQDPTWNHKAPFLIPDGDDKTVNIEVFDSDKIGKDKSLGKLDLDIADVLAMDGEEGRWYPLEGVKSGHILLMSDFVDQFGNDSKGQPSTLSNKDGSRDPSDNKRRESSDPFNKSRLSDLDQDIPVGKARFNIIRAKDLIKTDLVGKSDPYAVIKYGRQENKTPVVKNSQNPEWNHKADFEIPDGDNRNFSVEVFDSDKLGKDKSMGRLDLDIADVQDMADIEGAQGRWYPLKGVKSGQILLSSEILEQVGKEGKDGQSSQLPRKESYDPRESGRNKSLSGQGLNDGKARVNLIKAKDLIKTDVMGKSDPYAVMKYGTQKYKTPTVKNTQDPQWDCEVEFDVPEGDAKNLNIEVFDHDVIGKDKSLGTLEMDMADLGNMDKDSGYWFPLSGVKSGQVLLTGEIMDLLGDNGSGKGTSLSGQGERRPSQRGTSVGKVPAEFTDQIPEGQVNINLIKAKDLVKSDMIGKSDPYAVLSFGSQKYKTPKEKNTQNPEWNYEAKFDVPDGPDQTVNIEIFDSDKIGRDKSLGKLDIDVQDILNNDGLDAKWYPLAGVKSGQVLLTSDFLQPGSGGISIPDGGRGSVNPLADKTNKGKHTPGMEGGIPDGKVHLELIKAKDLENADKKGKSDPYAVLKYGNQKMKTNTIRNTQNPQWDFGADFDVPDGSSSDINIEVYDNDKLGRDKSLGKLDLDIGEILNNDGVEGKWYPLKGCKSGQILISSDFLPPGSDNSITSGMPSKAVGGKGSGAADPSKVKAFGPGLEKGKVLPGKPASFSVDSSKTGPAPIEVEIEADGKASSRKPSITQAGPGLHDVTYVPPPVGQPYQIGVKYGGEDIPGSPFEMSSNPDLDDVAGGGIPGHQNGKPGLQDRKESKIGVSVNPDSHNLGKIHVGLIAAKDLVKNDLVGKSDPYAILSHGNQKFKTNTVKNTQNPEWNYDADFNVPDGGDNTIKIDLFDADKFGKDKSLGSAILDVDDVMSKGIVPPGWYPLKGVKSGQVLMSADFEALGSSRFTSPDRSLYGVDDSRDPSVAKQGGGGGKGLKNRLGSRDQLGNEESDLPEGMLHVDLLAARNLVKSDLIGKSDPYGVLKLGDQAFKTDTVKNSQNPEWNYGADFVIDGNTPSDIALNIFDQDKLGKDKSLGNAILSVSDLIDRSEDPNAAATWVPLSGVKSGEVLVDTNFVPNDDMDMTRRMSGHGKGKQNAGDPNAKGLAALKKRGSNDDMHGDDLDEIPEGNVHVNLVKAKNLMKSDMVGKSDPYGIISCGNDKSKTKTIKNDQNPEFNHEAYFPVDSNGPRNIKIDLFDADKFGSDKPLGSANIDISDLAKEGPINNKWLPLKNGKSGEVMVTADFQPKFDDDNDLGSGAPGSISAGKDRGGGKGLRDKLKKDSKSQGRPDGSIIEDLQPGNLHLDLIQAKDLIKSDMIGKSDPYAVVSFDDEKIKTKTVKNNQNPEWNFDLDIPIDADGPRKIKIDVFDKDKIGKDKPLGSACMDVADIQKGNDFDKDWIPLDGVKSGQIQVSTDFSPESELPMRKGSGLGDVESGVSPNSKKNRKDSDMSVDGYGPNSRKPSTLGSEYGSEIPAGKINLNIHEGKDLVKADLIGKSDPYAVVTYGNDKVKTKTIKNNLNPEWNFETDIPVQENGPNNMKIEVFDSDKIGKDKSLGSANIDVRDLLNEPLEEAWIPLNGTKSGKIKVSADFDPENEYGVERGPDGQGIRKTSNTFSQSSYSRKTSEMSETHSSYSRKTSEVIASRKTSEVFSSRKTSEAHSSYSRKTSGSADSGAEIPGPGTINVNVHQAKDLVKSDMIGKSDPYAVVSYGNDKVKSKPVKNSQNPEWNFEAQLPVDENSPENFKIEVFDKDTFGKDKSLGSKEINIPSIANEEPLQGAWIPLDGVKSGHIQVSADYEPSDPSIGGSRKTSGVGDAKSLKGDLANRKRVGSPSDNYGKQRGLGAEDEIPAGNVHLEIIEAKNLIKADMIGKSDPYAVVTYGDDKVKTKTIKNDQNPKWNFEADIPTNPNGPNDVKIEIFDSDKFGKDKPLGAANIDLEDLINNGALKDAWIPLSGVKSGELKVSADFEPSDVDGVPNAGTGGPDSRMHGSKPMQKKPSKQNLGTNEDEIPYGNLHLEINQAKDLIKGDMIGKSDPYAVVTYGDDKVKTKTVKNNQNPEWGFVTDIPINPDGPSSLKIEVFDDDKLGKDKPLGSAVLDIPTVLNDGSLEDAWIPLSGVKSGQIQVSADFDPSDPNTINNRKHSEPGGAKKLKGQLGNRKQSGGPKQIDDDEPLGNVHLEIIQAKDLIKADLIGKSDPYAVVTYGDDKIKTKTIKNNLNPQWNFEADIPIDPNGPSTLKIEVFDDDKLGKDKPLGAADIDIPSLINDATLKDAWVPLSGVKSGQLQLSADYSPTDSDGYKNTGKPGGKIIPKPARDGMRNRGGSPGNDDDFGSLPNQRKPSDNTLVPGNIHLNIVQAKDLIKTDMIGKSDPFAVVTYGNEQIKTNTVKNNQNPEWNFEADIPYNPNYSDTLKIEIFDEDKLGKNKLLGTSYIDIPNLANNEPLDNVWIPLSGVKSGELQVSADFVPAEFHEYENIRPDQFNKMSPQRDSGSLGAPRSAKSPESEKLGKVKLDLLMAKDLIKTDMVGKSDPYAIITHGSQKFKTDIMKNTQNPEWNIQCEVEVPDSNDRNISIDLYDADKFGKDTFLGNLNLDIARVMNLGTLDQGWYPLDGVKQGQICVGADFIPEPDETSTIVINQRLTESRRTSTQFHEVNLNRIPLPSTGGSIEASIRTPSGKVDKPTVQDDNNGSVAVKYQPTEEGIHYLDVKYNGDQVQGSPFKFHVNRQNSGKASAYGQGLMHGVCGEPANFTVSTKGAGAGGLNLAVEGPSKADISCQDNKDGTVNVSYLPTAPGEYKITAKFADEHIPGSPFTCKITGENKKRNQISVGSSSELQLPGNLSESDLRSLKAYIESPSGGIEQCFLKKLPRGNIGISFTPREIGEHLVSVQRNGKHITNSPFKIVVNAQEVGDASRVKVSGDGLVQGKTHINNRFMINTKSAGYGGLSLSIEGPSKAEIDCKDNENGTLDVDYKPTEPGFYIINIKFADSHVPGSPFQVPISGEGTEKQTENIKRMREAVPVTEVGSQCRLTFKMPGIFMQDLEAMVTSPSGKSTKANVSELEEGLYAVNFVPYELGIHTVTVRYREMDIPGSPFQFTVGPLQDSGAHRVHAGGPGLARGVEGEPADFNVWTREAGPGSLAISVEGPSKAQIDFKDRKDGSCYVSYIVEEAGEYSVGIRFNDEHIPDSPYKVFIIPKSDHADKVKVSNLDDEQIVLNAPQSFLLSKNGASGSLQCKMVSPSGREDDCFMSQVGPDEYSVRFVPKEEGHHYLHAKLNGVHVPGSPFKIKVGGDGKKDGAVKVYGQGLDRVKTSEKASFVIDTSNVGAGTLSVTVDGPSKVDMDCNEVEKGYEVSYTPLVPGDYFVTVKYNGKNVDGSPFKVTATGGGAPGAKGHLLSRRESSSVTMETIQRTMIRQESSLFKESSSSSRGNSRAIAIQPNFISDASAVTCKGPGIERPILGKQNSFTVDCTRGGNNVLFVGVFGPDTPCDEVYVKHQGDRQYGVSYKLTDPGQYILYVKWGEDHIPGSPFHIEV